VTAVLPSNQMSRGFLEKIFTLVPPALSLSAFQLHVTPAAGSSNNCHMINKSGCRFLNIIGPHFLSSLSLGRLLLFRGIIIFGNDSRMSFLVRAAW